MGFTVKSILKANEFENRRKCSDNPLRRFIYGPGIDQPICMIDVNDANEPYYYHFDGLGSVVALSDTNGIIVEKYYYDAFGQPAVQTNPCTVDFND